MSIDVMCVCLFDRLDVTLLSPDTHADYVGGVLMQLHQVKGVVFPYVISLLAHDCLSVDMKSFNAHIPLFPGPHWAAEA